MAQQKLSKRKKEALRLQEIAVGVALYLQTGELPCTAKQCTQKFVSGVQSVLGDTTITLDLIVKAVGDWISKEWLIITEAITHVTRAGRNKVKTFAEQATEPAPA